MGKRSNVGVPPKWTLSGLAVRATQIVREPADVPLLLVIGAFVWRAPCKLRRHHVAAYLDRLRAAHPKVQGASVEERCERVARLCDAWLRRRFLRSRDSSYLRSLAIYRFVDPGDRPMQLHFAFEEQRDAALRARARVWVSIGGSSFAEPTVPRRAAAVPAAYLPVMADVAISIRTNGPYLVTGPISLTDADGKPVPIPEGRSNVALCRCGGSTNKPFCDGTHSKIGFDGAMKAVEEAG